MSEVVRVAVLGLGAMGSRMVTNLAAAGHEVTVWNRTAVVAEQLATSAPVRAAPEPRRAVEGAAVAISMLTDDEASRSVWLDGGRGALAAVESDAVIVECSTLTVAMIQELSGAATRAGIDLLEAPVVGSRPQADAGALVQLVGGDEAVLERVRAVLEVNADTVRHLGPVGSAATMKLVVNGLFGVQVAAYAELVGLLRRTELDLDGSIELLAGLPITSPGLQRILGLFAEEAYDPNFPVRLVAKDFGYLGRLADGLGAELPVSRAAGGGYEAGADGAEAELDIAGIARRCG